MASPTTVASASVGPRPAPEIPLRMTSQNSTSMASPAPARSRSLFQASLLRSCLEHGACTSALVVEATAVQIQDLALVRVRRYRNRARCHCSELESWVSLAFSGVASFPKFLALDSHLPKSPGVKPGDFCCLGDVPVRRLMRRRVVFDQVQKIPVNAVIVAEFRVERGSESFSLADQHRVFAFRRNHFHSRAHAFDLGRADEYHFNGIVQEPPFADGAVDLAAVSITAHRDVERAQAGLLRILNFCGQQDASRASAKSRLSAHEILQLREPVFTEQLEKRSRLAPGDY